MRLSKEELDDVLKKNPDVTVYGAMLPPEHPLAGGGVMLGYVLNKPHSKYRAIKTEHNGIVYHSKKEANKAAELDLLVKAGEISFYLRQVPFTLPGNIVYRADFVTFDKDALGMWWVNVIEVKGFSTPEWKMKLKLFKATYPELTIEVC